MTKILVGYASAHGSTKGIAEAIGARLIKAGLRADVRSIDEVGSIEAYDALVIGSAVHDRKWLPPAATFIRSHAAELSRHPLWLFSVGSLGETSSFFGARAGRLLQRMRKGRDAEEMADFRKVVGPRAHRNFAGAIETSHWSAVGGFFLKLLGGRFGDHRDWRDIDAWADGITRELRTTDEPVRSVARDLA
ncbi:MAG TPA: flavodoxin domain-containing protein [Kofleriaceae bacterium]